MNILKQAKSLLGTDFCKVELLESKIPLHIQIIVTNQEHSAFVEIQDTHTNITKIIKDDEVILKHKQIIQNT